MDYIRNNKKLLFIMAGVLLAGCLLFYWLRPASVAALTVTEQEYIPSLLLSGEVIAEGSTLLSSLSTGKVVACPVTKGESVKKGQLLVQIDDTQARIERERAASAVRTAAAQLEKAQTVTFEQARATSIQADLALEAAQRDYEQTKALAEAGAVSQTQLEQSQRNLKLNQELARSARAALESVSGSGSAIAILQAELQQRQLDLQEKERLLAEYQILAPADGELLDLYVKPGELLTSGSRAALLAAGQGLRVKVQPDQRYADLAAVGNKAQVWITNDAGVKWDASVVYTEPLGNAEQGSFTAELAFDQEPPLYPGQLLSVQLFAAKQPDAVILPENYLTMQDGRNGVWKAIDGRAEFVTVQLGIRTGDGVVITQGLKEGDMVLLPEGLQEGQRVSPRKSKV
ncbi:MAG TPA: biotin/lipoyl-binding protein [Syntrophomonadaceae bacterium]|mgnify:FL=1|nr:biotin/lipoyl-binding protein [Syntrophomonadaceae bacterium]